MTVGISAPPATLDPLLATDATGQRILELLHVPLVRIDYDLKVVPYGATTIDQSKNKIVFNLRKDIRFNNGEILDCGSFLRSFDLFSKPPSAFTDVFKNIKGWRCLAPSIFEIQMKHPDPKLLLNLFQIPAVPLSNDLSRTSSGPFELLEVSDEKIILKARSQHAPTIPSFELLEFRIVRDDTTRLLKLINQELDVVQNELPESKVQLVLNSQHFNLFQGKGLNINYLNFNHRIFPLNQKRFRQAVSLLIDRKALVQFKYFNLASPATSLLSQANPLFNSSLKDLPFDMQEAKKILSTFDTIKTITLLTSNAEASRDLAVIIKEQFKKVSNIEIKIESLDWSNFYSRLKNGNFQMALSRWTGIIDPDIYRESLATSQFPPGKNRGFYSNPQFDKIVEAAAEESDTIKREKMYNHAQEVIYDDLAIVPLWYNDVFNLVHKRIKGYRLATNGSYMPLAFCKLEVK